MTISKHIYKLNIVKKYNKLRSKQNSKKQRKTNWKQTNLTELLTLCDRLTYYINFQACIEDGTVSQIVRQRTLVATAALTLTQYVTFTTDLKFCLRLVSP